MNARDDFRLAINVEIAKRLGWSKFRPEDLWSDIDDEYLPAIEGSDPDGILGFVPKYDTDGEEALLAILKLAHVEIGFSPPPYVVIAETPTGERSSASHKHLYEALFLLLIELLGIDAEAYRQNGEWVIYGVE